MSRCRSAEKLLEPKVTAREPEAILAMPGAPAKRVGIGAAPAAVGLTARPSLDRSTRARPVMCAVAGVEIQEKICSDATVEWRPSASETAGRRVVLVTGRGAHWERTCRQIAGYKPNDCCCGAIRAEPIPD